MSLRDADPHLLNIASLAQQAAFNPTQSIWVAANAGTGKTTVLTRRILALLLADEELAPHEILALSFTRAAAAEMAVRLPKLVNEFAALSGDELHSRISDQLGVTPPANPHARLQQLQQLLAQQPPLMTTLHGFAQHLLAALPAASSLPEGFGLLDEVGQNRLLRDVQQRLVQKLPETLLPYLNKLLDELGEHGWDDLTQLIIANWWQLEERLEGQGLGGIAAMMTRLEAALQLPPAAEIWAPVLPTPEQREVLTERGYAVATEEEWLAFLLTKTLTPKKSILSKANAKGLSEAFMADLAAAAEHAAQMKRAQRAVRGLSLTEALLTYGATVRAAYNQAKQERGVLDFSDLLTRLNAALQASTENVAAQWLWYRLDRRFKHLVVDEAQDNNRAQGAVVQWLTRQLLAGEVGSTPRTVLAVGDVKQSIYRFQGAQPQEFYALRDLMKVQSSPAGFTQVELTTTFRNGGIILDVVNALFAAPELASPVQGEPHPWPTHRTVAPHRPNRVEIWPLVAKQAAEPDDEETEASPAMADLGRWPLAHERAAAQLPSAKLRCLQQVVDWLVARYNEGVVVPSTRAPLDWADVMIVVRTNATAQLMAGLLRRAGVPVAAPRGESSAAVQDVAAMVRLAFNPTDNLACAQVLKGLLGWEDGALLNLARQAAAGAWWDVLPEGSDLKEFFKRLPQPYTPTQLIQTAVAAWGLDIQAFRPLLAWAESAETGPEPRLGALGTLVQRLEEEDLPVVTQPGVQVLTLHTAKGLEAPLVILPEAGEPLTDLKRVKLLWGQDIVLFKQGQGISQLEDDLLAQTQANQAIDSLRALYVALTRAADWLVVCGWENRKKRTADVEET